MRLSVCIVNEQEFSKAVDFCHGENDILGYYTDRLTEASDKKLRQIDFKSIEAGLETSEAFRVMGLIEESILAFLKDHDLPENVRIVCTDEEVARLYKVVYNFRFADTKANRMADDNWD